MSEKLNAESILEKEGLLGDVRTNLSEMELLPSHTQNNDSTPDTPKRKASFLDRVILSFAFMISITVLFSIICAAFNVFYTVVGLIILSPIPMFTINTASFWVYAEISVIGGAATGGAVAIFLCFGITLQCLIVRRQKAKPDLDGFRKRHNGINGFGGISTFFDILSIMSLCFIVKPKLGVMLLKYYPTAFGSSGEAVDLEGALLQEAALVGIVVVWFVRWLRTRCRTKPTTGKVEDEHTAATGEAINIDPVEAEPLVSVLVEQV